MSDSFSSCPELWWQLDTRWGCGAVVTRGDVITDSAPIFKRLRGQLLHEVVEKGRYVLKPLHLDTGAGVRAQ